ncbi:MAG: Gfo/Idh/MocA family oxidoreductase [Deferribacteraceae bacterium]|jgi:myo-inositol 2-dehydrogenase/D-chiro-inositol 1-dehydrogenase/scyllo-inositol 2-dehydrogenase (NAD+)|nr:Gfo/Idh/MocA family oxidoreductase [Deferribacteraceae bacterium]
MNSIKKICLIGAGRAGMIHARNFKHNVPGFAITAVADPIEAACQAACKELEIDKYYLDYKQALADPSICGVIVVSPTKFHCEIVVAAAEAGKHVLCEKPMAMNAAECELMIAACEKAGVILQIGFMRRYDAGFVAAKEAIDAGAIGEVVLVKSLTRGPSTPQPWMYDIKKSNGPLAEVNSHDIDTLHWFTGSEFAHVYAIAGNYRCHDAKAEFPDFYDNVVLTGRFKNGMQGSIDGAQGVGYGYDARVEILGTDGIIYLGDTSANSMICADRSGKKVQSFMRSWTTLFTEAYLSEDRHFAECILTQKTPRVTGVDGKNAVKVVEAGNQSIATGQIVFL